MQGFRQEVVSVSPDGGGIDRAPIAPKFHQRQDTMRIVRLFDYITMEERSDATKICTAVVAIEIVSDKRASMTCFDR